MTCKMSSDNLSHFAAHFVFKAVAGRMPCTSQNHRFGAVGVTESRESSWACNSKTALSVKTDYSCIAARQWYYPQPFVISLMVSVDVKHHVVLTSGCTYIVVSDLPRSRRP